MYVKRFCLFQKVCKYSDSADFSRDGDTVVRCMDVEHNSSRKIQTLARDKDINQRE